MKVVFHAICISPHQVPWASEMVRLCGESGFVYLYDDPLTADRKRSGWIEDGNTHEWLVCSRDRSVDARLLMLNADILVSGIRDLEIFEARAKLGRRSFYTSERWLKPPIGLLRVLSPRYLMMAKRMVALFRSDAVVYLPTGVTAAADMVRVMNLMSGHVFDLLKKPVIEYEKYPMGRIEGYSWMRMWGYFVAPSPFPRHFSSATNNQQRTTARVLRVLWVGRMLALKRVDTLIRAVHACAKNGYAISLTVVGGGEAEEKWRKLDAKLAARNGFGCVKFIPAVAIDCVRDLMHNHDVYVFPSNGYDGWGAVVSEALEEGMEVFGSDEAGSTRTMLPKDNLFKVGDWRQLAALLIKAAKGARHCVGIGPWSAKSAAANLVNYIDNSKNLL